MKIWYYFFVNYIIIELIILSGIRKERLIIAREWFKKIEEVNIMNDFDIQKDLPF